MRKFRSSVLEALWDWCILYFLDADERTEKFKAGMHKQETFQNYLTF